jgi:hypothetical protein
MLTPRLRVVLVVTLLGAGLVRSGGDPPLLAEQAAVRSTSCAGLDRASVSGDAPTYTKKKLATFANHRRLCHGIWLPSPRRYFVPQGLAIKGRTAWISGFHYRKGYGQRPCQLLQVDIVTGKRLASHTAIYGHVGDRPRTYCRHGGGIIQRGRSIWLVEKNKLWLVDPAQKGAVIDAQRVWRLHAPVRGSAVVATADRIGLVPYQARGKPRIYWFSWKRLLRPGVLDLALRHSGTSQLGPTSSTRIPRYAQGAVLDASGRLYLSRSNLSCGELVTPYGRRVAFIPGAEGLQFSSRGKRLWTVSESGAQPYATSRKPLTPALSSFEWPALFRGKKARCGFPAY